MKKIILKTLLMLITILFIIQVYSMAAVVTSTDKQVESGSGNVTITVTANQALGAYKLTLTDTAGLYLISASAGSESAVSPDNKIITGASTAGITKLGTFTFSVPNVTQDTKYNIKFSITGMETTAPDSIQDEINTAVITVKAKQTTQDPMPEPEPTPQEPTFKSTNKIVYANGDINLRASWSTSSAKVEIKKGTELKLTGTSTEKVNGYVWYRVEYNGQTKYVSSSLITETKPEEEKPEEKSSNANLSKLTVTPSGLTPEFSKDVKEYTLTIGSDIEKIDVSATPEDEKATVKIEGNTSNIKEGDENIVTIKVTAEDGTVNTYKITVTKTKKEQLKLKTLSLNGIELSPEFSHDIYEYKVDIKDIDKLEIEAIANRDDATVEVVGNSNFNEGENIITIMVKSQDESEIVTYQIIANKSMSVTNNESNSIKIEDYALYIVIALIILVLIILVIIIIINKKKKQNIDGEYYTGLYNEDKDKDEEIKETENNEDIYEENNDENVEETKRKKTRKKDGKHF